ncbi:MAG: EAL domain-containing protein [Aquimonas sp.]|nr:EAL domain-containing protein [Aquimonas sp.]
MRNRSTSRRDSFGIATRSLLASIGALLVGLTLSALLAREHARLLETQQAQNLVWVTERASTSLQAQLESAALLVRATQALFNAAESVSEDDFVRMYEDLQPRRLFPALRSLAYARLQPAAEPDTPDGYPTVLFAPLLGNERVSGLDIRTQPANLAALERARDTDEVSMSAVFDMVQLGADGRPLKGFILRAPHYSAGPRPLTLQERRQRFIGSPAASFTLEALLARALPEAADSIRVRIFDLTDGDPQLLFGPLPDASETTSAVRVHEFAGRRWSLELAPDPALGQSLSLIPLMSFAFGAVASLLLAALFWKSARTRDTALSLANEMSLRFRESELRFRALNDMLPAAVLLARADQRITYLNFAGRQLLGADEQSADLRLPDLFESPELARRIAAGDEVLMEADSTRIRRPDGAGFWAQVSVTEIELDGEAHRLAVIQDNTESHALTERLRHQAAHDSLTGLLNRASFEQALREVAAGPTVRARQAALLYLDLDQFKLINDTVGHDAGDRMVGELSSLLLACVEPSDVLARLGGDEFGLLLRGAGRHHALAVAESIRQTVRGHRFIYEGKQHSLTVSIGVVVLDQNSSRDTRELLALADTACYMAKESGRNRVHLTASDDLQTRRRRDEMAWVNRLKQAISEHRLELHYQRIESLAGADGSGHIELLLRLRDEDGRMVPPAEFIPPAERYALMPTIDRWVVQTALALMQQPRHAAGLWAINLSATTLEDDSFADFVCAELGRSGVAASRLCFEVTETAALTHMERAMSFINRMRTLGCRFALDDFGSGMSSFGYLKQLPVDMVKIDGSFIRDIETDPMSLSIVRALTEICHQAKVSVVAEFVETQRIAQRLRELGVDYAQGYAIHRPEPLDP